VQTFKGVERTKKRAKQCAAQSALQSCVQFHHPLRDLARYPLRVQDLAEYPRRVQDLPWYTCDPLGVPRDLARYPLRVENLAGYPLLVQDLAAYPLRVQDLARYAPDDDEGRRRRGLTAAEDFSNDHVNDDVIKLHPNSFVDGLSPSAEQCTETRQPGNHQFLISTRHFGSASLEDSLKSFDCNQLFNDMEGSKTARVSNGTSKEFRSKMFRYSLWDRRLGLSADEGSPPTDGVGSNCLLSSRRRWWNPVAVLSDLRPNVEYQRHQNVTSDDNDRQPGHREVHWRHCGRSIDQGPGRGAVQCRGRDDGGSVTITAVVDGRRFDARGRTVKLAKRRLAADVLRTVFNFRFIGQKPDSLSRH